MEGEGKVSWWKKKVALPSRSGLHLLLSEMTSHIQTLEFNQKLNYLTKKYYRDIKNIGKKKN